MSLSMQSSLSELPLPSILKALEAEIAKRRSENRIKDYDPYPKQRLFHSLGISTRERLLRAGNQLGKTYSGAAEMSYHLTGEYPDWWEGRVWNGPIRAWAGGKDGLSVRDSLALLLLGPPLARGTGMIPKRAIEDIRAARGLPDAVDTAVVKHKNGGISNLTFKSYEQGRERWQAATLDLVWLDEEPDEEIYTEALSRTNATGGMLYMTFTPLLGMSSVVRRFLMEDSPDRSDTNMTIDDALHIPQEQRDRIIASYPAHEREARTRGTPALGSGRIFPVAESAIEVDAFPIPPHWPQIGALDFGWDHPTAAVKLAWDRDADAVYVTHAYRKREAIPAMHAASLRGWGDWLPWAWPHDGLQHDKGSGDQLAQLYRKDGLKLLAERAQYEGDRGSGVEAGLMDMLERMETSRFYVFKHLVEWFDEFRLYHRKDGKVVKLQDDLMSATRYGIMSLRFAKTGATRRPIVQQFQNFDPSMGMLG
jgi:phage terminase large subunit-like protein